MLGLSKLQLLAIAAVVAIAAAIATVAIVYRKGEKAGASDITVKVQEQTVKTIERARQEKEKTDATVRDTAIDAVIDGLR